eukprot:CAMPEP_0172515894 /NCGR_PEP_ID=MMETSP1066-20121228/271805_1 /TAXON_ID=671091 /ORGANISM="Coscinodiscus wailesii, Strain CCMP2513" /LENGTH=68 /DNA_ID=CAMNT_0013297143 /DNA_START=253 /DNA_END=459 /DNA_ORIENTATION=-
MTSQKPRSSRRSHYIDDVTDDYDALIPQSTTTTLTYAVTPATENKLRRSISGVRHAAAVAVLLLLLTE